MKDSLDVLMVIDYYSNTLTTSYRKGAGLGPCKAGLTTQVLKIYPQWYLSKSEAKTLTRNGALSSKSQTHTVQCFLASRTQWDTALCQVMLQNPQSLGARHMWMQSSAELNVQLAQARQQHVQLLQDRAQEGLQNPSGKWGKFCSKTSLHHPHHTLQIKDLAVLRSNEMSQALGNFGVHGPWEALLKCPVILTGPTATAKAGPAVHDPSNKWQLYMSFSTLTEHVRHRYMRNSLKCTSFTVSTVPCSQSLQKGILMAWK